MADPSPSKSPIPWARLTAEGAAIVISILIAFAIDAWWDGQRDRARQQEFLEAVADEVRLSRENIRESLESNRVAQGATQDALLRARSDVPIPADSAMDVIDSLTLLAWILPATSALEELVSSGGLSTIRDAGLRSALGRWQAQLARARRTEDMGTALWNDQLLPILIERADLSSSARLHVDIPTGWFAVDIDALMQDRVFLNAIMMRTYARGEAMDAQQALVATATDLIAIIERNSP